MVLAPLIKSRKGHYRELFEQIAKQGFLRVRVDGEIREIEKGMRLDRYKTHDIEVVIDRLRHCGGVVGVGSGCWVGVGVGGGLTGVAVGIGSGGSIGLPMKTGRQ